MDTIHETDAMVATFDRKSSILICECKDGQIEMTSLLRVVQIWFESCFKTSYNFVENSLGVVCDGLEVIWVWGPVSAPCASGAPP